MLPNLSGVLFMSGIFTRRGKESKTKHLSLPNPFKSNAFVDLLFGSRGGWSRWVHVLIVGQSRMTCNTCSGMPEGLTARQKSLIYFLLAKLVIHFESSAPFLEKSLLRRLRNRRLVNFIFETFQRLPNRFYGVLIHLLPTLLFSIVI